MTESIKWLQNQTKRCRPLIHCITNPISIILIRYHKASIICISIFFKRMLNYNQKEEQDISKKKKRRC